MNTHPGDPVERPRGSDPGRTVRDHDIDRVRGSMRRTLVVTAVAGVLALGLTVVTVLGGLDYILRFPAWLRWLHLIALGIGLAVVVRRRVSPAWHFHPSLSTVALQIESRHPEARDKLATGLDLAGAGDSGGGFSDAMARLALNRSTVPAGVMSGLVRRTPMVHSLLVAGVIALSVTVIAVLVPSSAQTAAVRTLAPWSGVHWPKRSEIYNATTATKHPRGEPVPLRVVLARSVNLPANTDVTVAVRVYENGHVIDRYRMLTSWQKHQARAAEGAVEGQLFESIVSAAGDTIEYRFESIDDTTPWRRVELIERPAVLAASARVRRPEYLIATAPETEPEAIEIDMGPGDDERATAPPALLGSSIEFRVNLNKPIPAFPDDPEWARRVLGPDAAGIEMTVLDDAWTLRFEMTETLRLALSLTDRDGIGSEDLAVYRFPSVRDLIPGVVVIEPDYDTTVLPTAEIKVRSSAQDDVGLAALWTSAQRFVPEGEVPSGRGGAVRPEGEAEIFDRVTVRAGDLTAESSAVLKIERFGAEPGDEIRVSATAIDVYGFETNDREPVVSEPRRLFVVSVEEFAQQIQGSLQAIRREAIRLYEQQDGLRARTESGSQPQQVRRDQESLGRETQRQIERIGLLRDQIETNRLDDPALDALTRGAESLARSAAEHADNAARNAAGLDQPEDQPGAKAETLRAQDATLDDLQELVGLLDRGEDAWTARRNIEKLIREQQRVLDETRELGQRTAGLTPDELSEDQQSDLEQIARDQQGLAEQSRGTAGELREAQESLRESNPAEAAALSQAAQSLEQADVARTMEHAAQQAQDNRTARAAELQQQALEDLQDALEQLDDAQRARDEQLRRVAQSLVETIEALVADQQLQLERLGRHEPSLDDAMIALRTRTFSAQQLALSEQELKAVAAPLADADSAQSEAITELRRSPSDAGKVRSAESRSLRALQEALAEAKKQQEQIEQEAIERERDELEKAYRAALKSQIELRDQTRDAVPPAGVDRRARAELRRLASAQDELGNELTDLYTKTTELGQAVVFRFAHERLRVAVETASADLRKGDSEEAQAHQNRAISLLRGMIEAMAEEENNDDFDDGGGGGGGGGGQGGAAELIPSGAQLKLLRAIQSDLLDRTRAVDEGQRPPSDLESLAPEQRELSDIGKQLIDELTNPGPQAPGGDGP